MAPTNEPLILRMRQLATFIGLSRSKIYEMLNESSERYDPDFPKQIRLGASAVGWDKSEVLAWLEKRRQQRE